MSIIIDIEAYQILDSRGNPTLAVEIITKSGISAIASVPSGASTGRHEAMELRDNDNNYGGKGVLKAVNNVNTTIKQALLGLDVCRQYHIDSMMLELDGTKNKSKLGANAILGVSIAACKAGAIVCHQPLYQYIGGINARQLPTPMFNIINGGLHASNKLDIQEFMIIPSSAPTFSEALHIASKIFHTLKTTLTNKGYNTGIGDEGGFAPEINTNDEALELIIEAIEKSGYEAGKDIYLALDVAATELYDPKNNIYKFYKSNPGKKISSIEMVDYLSTLVKKYPIISIEDGCSEDDWDGWQLLTKELGNKCQLVGDDLFVTNPVRLTEGIEKHSANAVLIKMNQIGTLTETLEVINMAKTNNYNTIISHRSGETEDTTIADLAVALNTGQIKTGSVCRSERVAKYNRLLRIEQELQNSATYNIDHFNKYI
ncbi:MAG: phosphopyruvate hydratase [Solitalea-like symbiont of Acarus siro]